MSDLNEALTILRLLTDETPCTPDPSGMCRHRWVHEHCPDRRAWDLLSQHPEITPSLPTDDTMSPSLADRKQALLDRSTHRALSLMGYTKTPDMGYVKTPGETPTSPVNDLCRVPPADTPGLDPQALSGGTVYTYATQYEVSLFPVDSGDHCDYAITVELVGPDKWAVWYEAEQLVRDAPQETALRLARALAPHIAYHGKTATQALTDSQGNMP